MSLDLAAPTADRSPTQTDSLCPDVYFTPGYGAAAAVTEHGTWHSQHSPGKITVPYILRRIPEAPTNGAVDAVSPYGYSGIHIGPDCSPAEASHYWAAAVEHWRDLGVVSLFLRFSPLDRRSVKIANTFSDLDLTQRMDTITVAVDRGPDHVWDAMQGRSRTAIRKARNAGLTAEVRRAVANDVAAVSPFRALYEQTMTRVASTPQYFFPDVYYRLLVEGCADNLLITYVRDAHGTVVAAALILTHRDRAHYHLAGSTPDAARNGANNLLLWTIMAWAADHGCSVVHLGGGVRPGDGLFRFKQSFGGTATPFWTGAVVLDHTRYDALLSTRAHTLGKPVSEIRTCGFFPGYRLERS